MRRHELALGVLRLGFAGAGVAAMAYMAAVLETALFGNGVVLLVCFGVAALAMVLLGNRRARPTGASSAG